MGVSLARISALVCVSVCVPCELVPSLKPVHLDVKRERAVTRPSIESHLSGL